MLSKIVGVILGASRLILGSIMGMCGVVFAWNWNWMSAFLLFLVALTIYGISALLENSRCRKIERMQRYNRIQFIFVQALIQCLLVLNIFLSPYLKWLPNNWKGWYIITVLLAVFVITIIAIIKRLHDIGYSGYWIIPIIGLSLIGKSFPDIVSKCIDTGIVTIFALLPGSKMANQYGLPSKDKWKLW
jgi:uncharacterized membrane protein YhaH (DUF805 family)